MEEKAVTITNATLNLAGQEWIDRRNVTVETARSYAAINDDNVSDAVGEVIQQLQKLTKQLDDNRKELTRPLDAAKKQLTSQQKELQAPIDAEYTRLRGLLGEYATKKAQEREEAERARRQAEAEAQMLAEEEARKAAEEAAKQVKIAEVFGVSANQPQAEPLPPPPPQVVAVPVPIVPEKTIVAGMKQVAVIVWEITDAAKLDRKFLSPDEKKIRAFADDVKKNGIDPEAINEPGIVFHKEIRMDVK
jgi:ABC-type transporter Mla subunit MlaD